MMSTSIFKIVSLGILLMVCSEGKLLKSVAGQEFGTMKSRTPIFCCWILGGITLQDRRKYFNHT